MKRKILSISAALLLLHGTGCQQRQVVTETQEQVEISLSWWGNDSRTEYTLDAVEEFQRLHPGIKVKCSYSEWSGYESRSRVQMVSDTEADVMQVNFNWLSEYSPDGSGYYDLETISPELLNLTTFSEEFLNYGRRSGILNAVPIAMNTETMYLNKTLYDQYGLAVPETWEDYFQAAQVMQKDSVYPLSGVAKCAWLVSVSYAEQVTGKPFFKENETLNFTAEDLQIMLEFYVRLVQEKVMPQVEYFERYSITNGTYAGSIAWVSDAVNYFGSAQEAGFEIITVPYPTAGGASGEGWYAKPATLYAISKNTEHPEESAVLLDFLLNSPEMAALQGVEKGIPLSTEARKTLDEEGLLTGIQYEAAMRMEENDEFSVMRPFLEDSTMIDSFIEACNQVLYKKASAEVAANTLYHTMMKLYNS